MTNIYNKTRWWDIQQTPKYKWGGGDNNMNYVLSSFGLEKSEKCNNATDG